MLVNKYNLNSAMKLKSYPALLISLILLEIVFWSFSKGISGWERAMRPPDTNSRFAKQIYSTNIPADPLELLYIVETLQFLGLDSADQFDNFLKRGLINRALGISPEKIYTVAEAIHSEERAISLKESAMPIFLSGISLSFPTSDEANSGKVVVTNKLALPIKIFSLNILKAKLSGGEFPTEPYTSSPINCNYSSLAPNESSAVNCQDGLEGKSRSL